MHFLNVASQILLLCILYVFLGPFACQTNCNSNILCDGMCDGQQCGRGPARARLSLQHPSITAIVGVARYLSLQMALDWMAVNSETEKSVT